MITRYKFPALFLGLVALLLVAACSHGGGGSDSMSGNVRVNLTAGSASNLTSSAGRSITTSSLAGTTGSIPPLHGDGDDGGGDDVLSMLAHVNVTLSSLIARNLNGELIDFVIDLPRTVDLIGLMNGNQVTLPTGTLPPGMYDQIIVVIRNVEFVFLDGRKVELTPPGGGWTRIVPVTTFEVIEGQTTTIELRFMPSGAFRDDGGRFEFDPDFECHTDR